MRFTYPLQITLVICTINFSLLAVDFKVGDAVEASSYGHWYAAKILAVEGGKYKVHYNDFGSSSDELVTTDRVRAVDPAAASAIAAQVAQFTRRPENRSPIVRQVVSRLRRRHRGGQDQGAL